MSIDINRSKLSQAVQSLSRIATSRSTIQALAGIRLRSEDGMLELQATNMEISLSLKLDTNVSGDFDFVLPGRLFSDIVRSLTSDRVEIALDETLNSASVKSGSASFNIKSLSSDDFPRLPEVDQQGIEISKESFVDTVEWVEKSASVDETRPILTSVLVKIVGDTLMMVATDSYRLSVKETKLEGTVSESLEANIPAKSLQELCRIASQEDSDHLLITVSGGQVVFSIEGTKLYSRLIDGQFPNYKQLIPESFDHELSLNSSELLEAVKRVGLMAQKNYPLKMAFNQGSLEISAKTPDVGTALEKLEIPYMGDLLEIGFNPDFLRGGIESARSENITMKLISPLRPTMIESDGDQGYTCLIMPVRLNDQL